LYIWRCNANERRRSAARVAALASTIDGSGTGSAPPLFERPAGAGAHPLVKSAAGFCAVTTIIFIVAMVSDARERRMPDAAAAPRAQQDTIALVAMSHVRRDQAFVVHGLVRNQSARRVSGLSAVITVLDAAGRSIATARAALDDESLPPGESSRFEVRLDDVRAVERYRVSFVGAGGVVRHLDVRSRANQPPPRSAGAATPASTGF
jgi:hypothetical protein